MSICIDADFGFDVPGQQFHSTQRGQGLFRPWRHRPLSGPTADFGFEVPGQSSNGVNRKIIPRV